MNTTDIQDIQDILKTKLYIENVNINLLETFKL